LGIRTFSRTSNLDDFLDCHRGLVPIGHVLDHLPKAIQTRTT